MRTRHVLLHFLLLGILLTSQDIRSVSAAIFDPCQKQQPQPHHNQRLRSTTRIPKDASASRRHRMTTATSILAQNFLAPPVSSSLPQQEQPTQQQHNIKADPNRLEQAVVRIENNEEEYRIVPYYYDNKNDDDAAAAAAPDDQDDDETDGRYSVTRSTQEDDNHRHQSKENNSNSNNEDEDEDDPVVEEYDMEEDEILLDDDDDDDQDEEETTTHKNLLRGGHKNNDSREPAHKFPLEELFQNHPSDSDAVVVLDTKEDDNADSDDDEDDWNEPCLYEYVVNMGIVVDSSFCKAAAATSSTETFSSNVATTTGNSNNNKTKNKNVNSSSHHHPNATTTKQPQPPPHSFAQLEWAATQQVLAIVEATNLLYQTLCIRLHVGRLDLLCDATTDPIAQFVPIVEAQRSHSRKSTCGSLLHLFRKNYVQRHFELQRDMDIVHLFHSHDDGSSTLGCAIPGHVCNLDDKTRHVGVSRITSSWMRKQQKESNNYMMASSLLVAHETAHTLGSRHRPEHEPDTSIMYPKFRVSAQRRFTLQSKREIYQTLNATQCVTRVAVPDPNPPEEETNNTESAAAAEATIIPTTDSTSTTNAPPPATMTVTTVAPSTPSLVPSSITATESPSSTTANNRMNDANSEDDDKTLAQGHGINTTAPPTTTTTNSTSTITTRRCSKSKLACWFQLEEERKIPRWTMALILMSGGVMTLWFFLGRWFGIMVVGVK